MVAATIPVGAWAVSVPSPVPAVDGEMLWCSPMLFYFVFWNDKGAVWPGHNMRPATCEKEDADGYSYEDHVFHQGSKL